MVKNVFESAILIAVFHMYEIEPVAARGRETDLVAVVDPLRADQRAVQRVEIDC